MSKDVFAYEYRKVKKLYPAPLVEAVRRLYVDEGMTMAEVASELGTTSAIVYRLMRNHGLPIRVGGQARKVFSADLVEAVRHLYVDQRMTQREVPVALAISYRTLCTLMRNHEVPRRVAARQDQSGAKNPCWRGDRAGYAALHVRVRAVRGQPRECARCGKADQNAWYDGANLSGDYADVNNCERMCRSCHGRWDAQRRAVTGKATSVWTAPVANPSPQSGIQPPV